MRIRSQHVYLTILSLLSTLALASDLITPIHESGRCAIRGSCGKQGFFGRDLPCPDNSNAKPPSDSTRSKLVELCGEKWKDGDVCCEEDQVDALKGNLKLAEGIIYTCPACKENFFNLFCTFTCSPDQSLFVNVTEVGDTGQGRKGVTELDSLWSTEYQSGFYDSCKEVKNGASGGKAMAFIGGGAKNYTEFLKFLGDKKVLGSPFQMNYIEKPRHDDDGGMKAAPEKPKKCNDEDPKFRCQCVDCPESCKKLPEVEGVEYCHVGKLPCLSFAVIIVYSVALVLLVVAISGHVAYAKHRQRKSERLQLLQDAAPSDDEDEGDLVHNAGLLDRPRRNYYLNQIFDRAFSKLGRFCARYPGITIGTNLVIVGLLSLGWLNFEVEVDPVKLWVSPTSDAAEEKAFFDDNFGPFYRTQQAFLINDTSVANASVLSYDTLHWWFGIEDQIARMRTGTSGLSLDDVCFKPLGDACVVQSIHAWFEASDLEDWEDTIDHCAENPGSLECLPPFKDPLIPGRVLGGYSDPAHASRAKSLVTTWVVNNGQPNTKTEARADEWEILLKAQLLDAQREANDRGLRLSFSTERSLEEELNKSTNTDAKIVAISYVVMFFYASLALGSASMSLRSLLSNPANALVQSKFSLGVIGIVIVLMSVSGSVGLFSAIGVKVTLIIAEVIPFLVLAVGVDNIFLIVHEFERVNISHPDEEIDDRIAKALGRMGPSILLSASTETVAFAMGVFVGMPAVKNFAAYAAGAVVINAILQVTMFVSVLALNQRRVESLRADCFPCVTVRRANSVSLPGGHFFGNDEESRLQRFIRKSYAPTLLNNRVKTVVLAVFITVFAAALAFVPEIELGLDQRIALPSDSYLIQYYDDLYTYFGSGPPVYFVARDLNMTERVHQKQTCGTFLTCDDYSLANILEQESKRPEVSYINSATASWIDDYFGWLNPQNGCCEERGKTCLKEGEWNVTLHGMPTGDRFVHFAQKWLHADTTEECPTAGAAAYSTNVVVDPNTTSVPASNWRTFHTPLKSQADLINSYAAARRISNDISARHEIDVFPYSKHYVFFDQYATIIKLTATLLCVAVAIIFILSSLLLGSLVTGAVISVTAIMILVDILGVMAIFKVSLNALSLVNLVISVGIAVEFLAHISRAFMFPSKNVMERARSRFRGRDLRAWTALVNVGGSVFSGITITKFLGVAVLAFTRSKIFEVYYFRIWLALVITASLHALVWLPVALSLFGGEGYIDPESEGGLEEDLASRRYRSLVPDDEYDSEDD